MLNMSSSKKELVDISVTPTILLNFNFQLVIIMMKVLNVGAYCVFVRVRVAAAAAAQTHRGGSLIRRVGSYKNPVMLHPLVTTLCLLTGIWVYPVCDPELQIEVNVLEDQYFTNLWLLAIIHVSEDRS